MSKEYVYADARGMARFLRFRRYVLMSSDLPYTLVSWSYVLENERSLPRNRTHQVSSDSYKQKQAKFGFPTAAGGHRRLGVTARA